LDDLIIEQRLDRVLVLQFNAAHEHNPFNAALERAVTERLVEAGGDSSVGAVVLTGGPDRSFSVGGDFNEVSRFEGGPEVDRWIEDIVDLYVACLNLRKPTVAALDRFGIGIGFQLAMCCDLRVGTPRTRLIMPELRHGIACVLGQYILDRMLGRAHMQRIVNTCEPLDTNECLGLGLVNQVVPTERLIDAAVQQAGALAAYPAAAFGVTKAAANADFIDGLQRMTKTIQEAHRVAFRDRSAQRFMVSVLRGRT
jgi:enoyl-CoA hydratase/carnithine racemase